MTNNSKSAKRSALSGIEGVLGIFLFLGGLFGLFIFKQEFDTYSHCKGSPVPITAAKLATSNSMDNWYLRVSNYKIENATLNGSYSFDCTLVPNPAPKEGYKTIKLTCYDVKTADGVRSLRQQKTIDLILSSSTFGDNIEAHVRKVPTSDQVWTYLGWGLGLTLFGGWLYGSAAKTGLLEQQARIREFKKSYEAASPAERRGVWYAHIARWAIAIALFFATVYFKVQVDKHTQKATEAPASSSQSTEESPKKQSGKPSRKRAG